MSTQWWAGVPENHTGLVRHFLGKAAARFESEDLMRYLGMLQHRLVPPTHYPVSRLCASVCLDR